MQGSTTTTNYRKTSAEIVKEAKNMLAGGGGARLVSTRRPITPREPRRQLYGRVAPAGRPPSAFSLRYLQFESRALPTLEPINSPISPTGVIGTSSSTVNQTSAPINFHRSESADSILENGDVITSSSSSLTATQNFNGTTNNKISGKLLPSLLSPPTLTASLDSLFGEDKRPDTLLNDQNKSNQNAQTSSIVKDHPLKRRQAKSLDVQPHMPAAPGTNESKHNRKLNKKQNSKEIIVGGTHTGGTKITKLARSNDLLSQSSTETLLEMLKGHAGIKECAEETVTLINGILAELFTRVKGAKGNWRGAVLGALYGLVECSSAKILLGVARVVLALCVTGSNLTGVCKLVFKLARNEVNDNLFYESDVPELLIDGLGRANPLDEPEACIYGYGAVRFLASSSPSSASSSITKTSSKSSQKELPQISQKSRTLGIRLARRGAIQLMILHLQIINEFGSQNNLVGPPLHALYQLSGALRALASIPSVSGGNNINNNNSRILSQNNDNSFPQIRETTFNSNDNIQLELAGPHLVRAAEICIGETEVQGNIIRTINVLSENDLCCEHLLDTVARIGILLGPIEKSCSFPEKPLGVISRIGYILGNIMAGHDSARTQFFNNDVAMEYLLATLEHFSNKKFASKIMMTQEDTVIDVLIKLVRVIANMAVNGEVGYGLGTKPPLGGIFLNILLEANNMKGKMNSDMEELLLATLCALHNLSFYQNAQSNQTGFHPGCTIERQADISAALANILNSGPSLSKIEAARVLGNMTRCAVARESLCAANGLKILVKCLESDDHELISTSCGVLVNVLSDWERRAPFRELRGPLILRDVLQKSAMAEDWLLSGIVCQALWNYLIDSSNVIAALGEDEADYIQGDLAEYLDEEKIFNGEQPDEIWEQFATVATDLLERIQSCISVTNSPCISSEDEDLQIGEVGDAWGDQFKKWLAE